MRTRIYLTKVPPAGEGRLATWDDEGPYIEVSHEEELTAEDVECFRALAFLAIRGPSDEGR